MTEQDFSRGLPSLYDYFYYDYWILQQLCDFGALKKFLKNHRKGFGESALGILYMIELAIMGLVNHLETLIQDPGLSELVQWGDVTIGEKGLQELMESQPEAEFIYSLLSIRKRLATLRFSDEDREQNITVELDSLRNVLDDLNELLVSDYKIAQVESREHVRMQALADWIGSRYNWIHADILPAEGDETEVIPICPGPPFFYLMPHNIRKSYDLRHHLMKSKGKDYLDGYSVSLLYLYACSVPEAIERFVEALLNVADWVELHKIGNEIRDSVLTRKEVPVRLYEEKEEPKRSPPQISVISNQEELKYCLRGRDIRAISDRYSGDYPNTQNLFLHCVFGAVLLHKYGQRDAVEIAEFKQTSDDNNRVEYSYAVYLPVGGFMWNASHWLLFDGLCAETEMEPQSTFRSYLDVVMKRFEDAITFRTHELSRDILREYINRKDSDTRKMKRSREEIKAFRGLLGEFLAAFHLAKEVGVAHLAELSVHMDLAETDVDVCIETEETLTIAQVKNSLSFDPEVHDRILRNFEIAHRSLGNCKEKAVTKVLFILQDHINQMDTNALWKKEKYIQKQMITPQDILEERTNILESLERSGVKTVFLGELRNRLRSDRQYRGLLDKLEFLYPERSHNEIR